MEKLEIALPKSATPCIFFAKGECTRGDLCKFTHIDPNANSMKEDCPICILPITPPKMFGLLSGCEHAVCLDCIRSWRKSSDTNERKYDCPVCRETSELVIPSAAYATGKEKNEIRAAYLTRLSTIPCKHFNYGEGHCPFAPYCHYAHLSRDGSLMVDDLGLQHPGIRPRRRNQQRVLRIHPRQRQRPNIDPNENPLSPEEEDWIRTILPPNTQLTESLRVLLRLYLRMGLSRNQIQTLLHNADDDDEDDEGGIEWADDDDDDDRIVQRRPQRGLQRGLEAEEEEDDDDYEDDGSLSSSLEDLYFATDDDMVYRILWHERHVRGLEDDMVGSEDEEHDP